MVFWHPHNYSSINQKLYVVIQFLIGDNNIFEKSGLVRKKLTHILNVDLTHLNEYYFIITFSYTNIKKIVKFNMNTPKYNHLLY